jgi:hypothetical protein
LNRITRDPPAIGSLRTETPASGLPSGPVTRPVSFAPVSTSTSTSGAVLPSATSMFGTRAAV